MTEISEVKEQQSDYDRFVEKAKVATATVSEVESFADAVAYAVKLCENREFNRLVISDDESEKLSNDRKVIAAPALTEAEFKLLEESSESHGFDCISSGMRDRLSGVDIGFTYGDIGIAETGTIVINCPDEELRLSTMVCEYHVCVLPKSRIVKDGFVAEPQLRKYMLNTPNYTAFITGPSRTADIERVLAIGVHGPLELHILVLED